MPQPLIILVIDANEERRAAIEQAVSPLSGAECHAAPGDNAQAVFEKIDELEPALVVLGAGSDEDAAFSLLEQLSATRPHYGYAIASEEDSADLVVRAMRAGAHEFLKLPPVAEDIRAAVDRILARKGGSKPPEQGQVITLFSGKGGCGLTLLATNIAVNIAAELPENSVVIVDMNLQLGDVGTFMDVRPRFTLADAAKEADHLDEEMLRGFLAPHPSGAQVLACPNDAEDAEIVTGEHAAMVLEMLKHMFRFVIVDTAHAFNDYSLAALDHADTVLLVTDMTVPAIRDTQRCLAVFKELGYADETIKVVVNRFYRGASVSPKDLRRALDRPLHWLTPNDSAAAAAAIDGGVPLASANPRSELTVAVQGLARSLAGLKLTAARRGGLAAKLSSWRRK